MIGGYVYRGPLQTLQGTYFFADFSRGTMGSFRNDASGITDLTDRTDELAVPAGLGAFSIASFGEGANGDLYVVDYGGRVLMLVPEPETWALFAAGAVLVRFAGTGRLRRG